MNGCNLKIYGIITVVLAWFKKEFKKVKQKRKKLHCFQKQKPPFLSTFLFFRSAHNN